MRPALQRLLGSPSALTVLRDTVECPNHVYTCPSCRASLIKDFSSKARLSEKRAPRAGGVSEQILSFVTGQFKKRRRAEQADIKKTPRLKSWTDQEVQILQKTHTHIVGSRIGPAPVDPKQQQVVSEQVPSFVTGEFEKGRRPAQADTKKALRLKRWKDQEVERRQKAHTYMASSPTGAASVVRKEQHDGGLNKNPKARPPEKRATGASDEFEQILSLVTGEFEKRRQAEQADIKKTLALKPWTDQEVQIHQKAHTHIVSSRTGAASVVRRQQHDGRLDKVDEIKEKPTHRQKLLSSKQDLHSRSNTRDRSTGTVSRRKEESDCKGLPQQHKINKIVRGRSDVIRGPTYKLALRKKWFDVLENQPEEETGVSPKYNDRLGWERDSAIQVRRYELSGPPPIKKYSSGESVYELRPLDLQDLECSSDENGVVYTVIPSIDALKDDDLTDESKTLGEDGNNVGVETTTETVQEQENDHQNSWEPFNRIHLTRLTTDVETDILGDFEAGSTLELGEESQMQELPSQIDIGSTNIFNSAIASNYAVPVHGKNWRSVLVDSEACESRRPSDSTGDTTTLQLRQLACDFESWSQSARSRRLPPDRNNGILKIWKRHLMHNQDLPTKGYLADELWEYLLEFGFSNRKRLNQIVTYSIALRKKTGRSWERFYSMIIMHWLQRQADAALSWHDTLYPMIHPTREQVIALVEYAYRSAPQSIAELQTIYEKLPFRDLYSPIMQHLYQKERFMAAASWHDVFIACRDLPEDSQDYKPLFRYIVLFGSQRRLAEMVNQMLDQQIPLPTFINRPMPLNPIGRETLDQRLAATHGIPVNTVGDDFHARLFATTWFSTETVTAILRMLGTETVGSASLRELALKERSDPQAIRARLNQLREAGIALTNSNFCKLVEKLCEEENARVLENVIECDLHPDTFEDQQLQESLLSTYHASGQQLQFDRTLAILLVNCPEKHHTTYYWNLHLRLHLKQKHLPSVMRTLQTMQASHLPLAIKSVSYVRICLLARRRVGMRPRTTKELFIITNIWQSVLRSGSTMPAHVWVEILKRLGMTGQLEEYEKLALWLADWYSSTPARAYLGGLLRRTQGLTTGQITRSLDVPTRIQAYRRGHPLNILFPARAQQAIIAWGFQHSRVGGPGWRWGLYMLLKLKQRKVSIELETVAKACRLRLISLFGKGRSNRLINRRERARNAALLAYYVQEMEKIGGKGLVRPFGYKRLPLEPRNTEVDE
jgi:hypothetical protein